MSKSIHDSLVAALHSALVHFELNTDLPITLHPPTNLEHGDLTSNIALIQFAWLKTNSRQSQWNSPRDLAEAIAKHVAQKLQQVSPQIVKSVSVAGPGFINLTLSTEVVETEMRRLVDPKQSIYKTESLANKKIIVEYTDPNPFKEFHIGHLYTNIVGESITRLLESQGVNVKRACYQGDVGMHVAKSVWGMQQLLAEAAGTQDNNSILAQFTQMGTQPLSERIAFLGKAYALGATAYKDDQTATSAIKKINLYTFKAAQERLIQDENWSPQIDYSTLFQQLSESDDKLIDYSVIKTLYETGRAWSLEHFDHLYAQLGTKFDFFFFESVMAEYGVKLVKEWLKKGVFSESQGAVIFAGSEYGLHDRVFLNSQGLPTYEAKELALAPEKYRLFPYDQSIIITGSEINEYFKVLLKAMGMTRPELAEKTMHIGHGMVRLPEGKMSSRTGNIVSGEWLLSEAQQQMLGVMEKNRVDIQAKDKVRLSAQIGLAAIKYALLKSNIGSDVTFDFKESLSFTGNSGPYMLYSVVRAEHVLKAVTDELKITTEQLIDTLITQVGESVNTLWLGQEHHLLRLLYQYDSVVLSAAEEFAPHLICTYLFELAQNFNTWYAHQKIVVWKNETSRSTIVDLDPSALPRLLLTSAMLRVLKEGLGLLGIQTVEEM